MQQVSRCLPIYYVYECIGAVFFVFTRGKAVEERLPSRESSHRTPWSSPLRYDPQIDAWTRGAFFTCGEADMEAADVWA